MSSNLWLALVSCVDELLSYIADNEQFMSVRVETLLP